MTWRGAVVLALLAVAAAGCGKKMVVPLDLELGAGVHSLLLIEEIGGNATVTALSLDAPDTKVLPEYDPYKGNEILLTAIEYAQTLTDLGILAQGPLELTSGSGSHVRSLPASSIAFGRTIAGDSIGEWTPLLAAAVQGLVAPLHYTIGSTTCVVFRSKVFGLDTPDPIIAGVPLDSKTALIMDNASTPHAYQVTAAGSQAISLDLEAGFIPSAAVADLDGQLWIAGHGAGRLHLWHGRLSTGFTRTTTRAAPTVTIRSMAVGRSGADRNAIFMVTATGELDRYQAGVWTLLSPATSGFNLVGALAWNGQDDLFFIHPWSGAANQMSGTMIYHYRGRAMDGTPLVDLDSPPHAEAFFTLASLDRYGPIAADNRGQVFRYTAGSWQLFGAPPMRQAPETIQPLGNGFMMEGAFGTLSEYLPLEGYGCMAQNDLATLEVGVAVPIDTGYVLAGALPIAGGSNNNVAVISPVH